MFDSENISLVTRIEAGDGVTITYSTNSEGESIYTAAVDQTWLTNWVNSNASGQLTLNDSDEARLKAVETQLGIRSTTTVTTVDSDTGTPGTTVITSAMDVATLTTNLEFDFSIVGIDGTNLATKSIRVSKDSAPAGVLLALYANMSLDDRMLKFMTPSYLSADNKLVLTWNEKSVGSTFAYTITAQTSGDNVVLTSVNY